MTKLEKGGLLRRPAAKITTKLALAALMASTAMDASAREFEISDGVTATTNVTLQAGVSIRTEDPDARIIGRANGAQYGFEARGGSSNDDDATLNFDKGDIVSAPVTAIADVDFNFDQKWGIFLRGKAVSDLALEFQSVRHGHTANGYRQGERLDDSDFHNLAKFTNAALLDAFVYADFEIAEMPITFRVGRQVVSWGESIFIQGGINTISPIDVPAFRRPGAQVKEGLLPVGMVYTNIGVTENLSVEAFLNYEWQKTVLDGCGTFFSTLDGVPDGCGPSNLTPGSLTDQALFALEAVYGSGFLSAERTQDVSPDTYSLDQMGVSLRYYSPELDTEFGLYYHHLHSRAPNVGSTATAFDPTFIDFSNFGALNNNLLQFDPDFDTPSLSELNTTINYQENIDTFGVSFATTVMGAAIAGEFSYRPNATVQKNVSDALTAGAGFAVIGNAFAQVADGAAPNSFMNQFKIGYDCLCERTDQFKGQISSILFFDQVLGASRITVIGEVGFERLLLDRQDQGWNYSRAFVFGAGERGYGNDSAGQISDFSYGYRLFARGEYPNWFETGLNFNPSVFFLHDVNGTSSDAQFYDNRKGIGLGAEFGYLNTYTVQFNYVNFFDGEYFTGQDRDFASATARVQF